jgi:hypothetical protein
VALLGLFLGDRYPERRNDPDWGQLFEVEFAQKETSGGTIALTRREREL